MDGWKTYVGAAFLGATALIGGLDTVLDPRTLTIAQAILGGVGAFLTAAGIGHKLEKLKNGG